MMPSGSKSKSPRVHTPLPVTIGWGEASAEDGAFTNPAVCRYRQLDSDRPKTIIFLLRVVLV